MGSKRKGERGRCLQKPITGTRSPPKNSPVRAGSPTKSSKKGKKKQSKHKRILKRLQRRNNRYRVRLHRQQKKLRAISHELIKSKKITDALLSAEPKKEIILDHSTNNVGTWVGGEKYMKTYSPPDKMKEDAWYSAKSASDIKKDMPQRVKGKEIALFSASRKRDSNMSWEPIEPID